MTLQWSRYQTAIFDAVAAAVDDMQHRRPFRHIVVEATAGSSKTTTCIECCRRMPSVRCVAVAFGKRNADELRTKLPSNATASTLHSLGLAAWTETLGGRRHKPEVDFEKVSRIIRAEVDAGKIPKWLRHKVGKLVDLARMHGIVPGDRTQRRGLSAALGGAASAQHSSNLALPPSASCALVNDVLPLRGLLADTDQNWEALMLHYDVNVGGDFPAAQIIRMARDVLVKSIRYGHRIIDFTDMLYLPTLAEGSTWRLDGDVVFVDELQDLDVLQRQMILHLVGSGCVFVGVGDSSQAIMGFRGAASDSMDQIVKATNAVRMPLSICYRCPTSHLQLARQLVPSIEARPDAGPGLLERYDEEGVLVCNNVGVDDITCTCEIDGFGRKVKLSPSLFQPGDLVICRAKAPLVKAAYWLLKARVPARILGKDLARGLLAFVDAMRAPDVTQLLVKVEQFTNKAIARAVELDDDAAVEEACDRRDVIRAVADSYGDDDVEGFKQQLEGLFGDGEDKGSVVTLSTIHRSKGAEADRVWWLDHQKPDPEGNYKHDWQRREALHIRFVAMTRARRELRLIRSEALK